jgi:hypothetical protein
MKQNAVAGCYSGFGPNALTGGRDGNITASYRNKTRRGLFACSGSFIALPMPPQPFNSRQSSFQTLTIIPATAYIYHNFARGGFSNTLKNCYYTSHENTWNKYRFDQP